MMTNMASIYLKIFSLLLVEAVVLSFMIQFSIAEHFSFGKRTVATPSCTINPSDKSAGCSDQKLKSVPQNLPADITGINLEDNNLTILRNSSFARYSRITNISIRINDIHFIETGTFSELQFLKTLNMSDNRMTELPQMVFSSKWVQYIGFSGNPIRSLTSPVTIPGSSCTLDLKNIRLSAVNPRMISALNIKKLDLGNMKIPFSVLRDLFRGVAKSTIEKLAFSSSGYRRIPHNLFDSLRNKSLSSVDFSGNKIFLYPFIFANLRGVSDLSLRKNKLEVIQPAYFEGMKSLGSLSLSYSSVRTINSDNQRWETDVFHLDLSHNSIRHLTYYTFWGLSNLSVLILSHNRITSIEPEYFVETPELISLLLDSNSIATINSDHTDWIIDLQNLNLDGNKLDIVGHLAFHGLNKLQNLSLNDNNLRGFDINLGFELNILNLEISNTNSLVFLRFNAPLLKSIVLSHDDLRHFFPFYKLFRNVPSIELMNLTGSLLLSGSVYKFGRISTLKFLYLRKVIDLDIWSGMFQDLIYLLELDLSENNIQLLPTDIFYNLSSLRTLDLRGNRMLSIPNVLLRDLIALSHLFLDSNKLTYIDTDFFLNKNTNLAEVNLAQNRLVSFNKSTFIPLLSTVESIDISNNPLICNCEIRWLIDLFQSKIVNSDETLCSISPATINILRGKPLLTFKPDEFCGPDIALFSSITIASTGFVIILFIIYKLRWFLRYKLFLIRFAVIGYKEIEDGRDREEFDNDINIIFADPDEVWAAENLRPMLQNRLPNFDRIAFGDDGLVLGMPFLDAVYVNVEKSFKTIMLISRDAIQNHIFMTKFRIALHHMTNTSMENVVLVLLEDIPYDEMPYPVRMYLSDGGAYLTWTDDERRQEYFWNELQKRVSVNRKVNEMIPPE